MSNFKEKQVKYVIIITKLPISKPKTFNNLALGGRNLKKDITANISISKPKYWPSRGYNEF